LKWLDEQQLTFAETDWPTVLECLSHSETLLHDFRDLRRRLKSHLPDTLYREALQFELQLEKQQQADLVHCLNRMTLHPAQDLSLTLQYCKMLGAEYLAELFSAPYRESDTPTS
ncbi:TIGR02444 family protein, partial [Vibrio cholerae]|nr:TIGR02444 family protein [Vibrio cholerae]